MGVGRRRAPRRTAFGRPARRVRRTGRKAQPGTERVLLSRSRGRARSGGGGRRGGRGRRRPRNLGRCAHGREGARLGRRLARHPRLVAVSRRGRGERRHGAGAAQGRRCSARRSDHVARVRFHQLDTHVPARHDPQPVESGANAGRFVGWFRGRGGVGNDADLHRERRRRVDPHPVCLQRPVRVQDELRACRLRRQLRQLAHLGTGPHVPFGARRRALRRRDRRPDQQRPHLVAAPGAVVRRRHRLRRRGRAAARQARGVVVDTRIRRL